MKIFFQKGISRLKSKNLNTIHLNFKLLHEESRLMEIMHRKYVSISRLFLLSVFTLLLSACSGLASLGESVDVSQEPSLTVQEYQQKATESTGTTKNGWNIMALKANLAANNYESALAQLNTFDTTSLTEKQNAEWLLARTQIQQHNKVAAKTVLDNLRFDNDWSLTDSQWSRYHTTRADLYQVLKDYLNSSRELISSRYYQSPETYQEISDSIWDNMIRYNASQLEVLNVASDESELQGWVFVAIQVKKNANNPQVLEDRLKSWFEMNPTHPIVTHTPASLKSWLSGEASQPKNIALLLPLSGRFGTQGQVIRDGFIHAMTNDTNRPVDAQLNIIDTAAAEMSSINQELINTKTDLVIGPLIKSNIESFQALNTNPPIPMLGLNFPSTKKEQLSVCYLTLSPEQEAEQGAIHIYQSGLRNPVVLVPRNTLGQRMRDAFQNKWKELSGTSAKTGSFGEASSFQSNVQSAFANSSADSAYVVATRSELTLIKPYIDISVPGDRQMPIFTSSRSNPEPVESFQDLDGVKYSDIPMIVNPNPSFNAEYDSLWPDSSYGEKRLHALGMDSYTLISKLPIMKLSDGYAVNGQTGRLTLGSNCIINRELSWGTYQSTAPAATDEADQDDESSIQDEDSAHDESTQNDDSQSDESESTEAI